jgi:hypothetical protein
MLQGSSEGDGGKKLLRAGRLGELMRSLHDALVKHNHSISVIEHGLVLTLLLLQGGFERLTQVLSLALARGSCLAFSECALKRRVLLGQGLLKLDVLLFETPIIAAILFGIELKLFDAALELRFSLIGRRFFGLLLAVRQLTRESIILVTEMLCAAVRFRFFDGYIVEFSLDAGVGLLGADKTLLEVGVLLLEVLIL